MRRLVFLAVTLLLPLPAPAQAVSLVGQVRWQGEVLLQESVRVEPDGVLTVAPGSTVTFTAGGLEVAGRLVATGARFTGDNWGGIVLKGCDGRTVLKGCTIDGAGTGILVQGGAPRLEDLTLTGNGVGMEVRQKSAAVVSGCRFRGNAKVGLFVKDEATATVTDSLFEDNGRYGAYIYRSVPARFADNVVRNNSTGVMISHYGSDPRIEGNRIEGNRIGVLIDRAARPVLTGNRLERNDTGLRIYRRSDPRVEGNRLAENRTAVSVAYSSYPTIRGNDFVGNGTALKLEYQSSVWEKTRGSAVREIEASARGAFGQGRGQAVSEAQRRPRELDATVDARGNWWGRDGSAELARIGREGNPSFLEDGRDTPTFLDDGKSYPLDTVRFDPWSETPRTAFEAKGN